MREWFIVGSKLLGIYFLYWALTSLLGSIGMIVSMLADIKGSFSDMSAIPFLLTTGFSSVVMIAFAYALLFKTELIADKLNVFGVTQPSARRGDNLHHGITLIGIYIFSTKIGGFAKVFASSQRANKINDPFAATQPQGLTFSLNYIEIGVTLIISLLLIFGSKYIAAFLTKERQTETEQ